MDLDKLKGCSTSGLTANATTITNSTSRSSRKRKLSTDFDDGRPIKRHESSSDSCSSPENETTQPPKIRATESSCNKSNKSSDKSEQIIDDFEVASSKRSQQSDSQTLYNSSFKFKVSASVEVVPSPADSVLTIVGSEVSSDFDIVSGYVSSPSNDYNNVFSPSSDDNLTNDENVTVISKGDKTPHALKKRTSSSTICYKTQVDEDDVACYVTPTVNQRLCPLPYLSWTSNEKLWNNMVKRDEKASLDRDSNMFNNHSGLQPRMRAILLDWLIEVCEVYKLHRETYYLTVDYLDRYLSAKESISKNQLQLIGITCLFIASKVEEIYPPKLHEFAYVTDSACTEEDILQQEFLVLQTLNWCITPMTIIGWAGIYMQLYETMIKSEVPGIDAKSLLLINSSKWSQSFVYPQFSGFVFTKIAQILDLSSLDVQITNFPYSIVAAAAFGLVLNKNIAEKVSGLSWGTTISLCAKWMEPYYQVLNEEAEINPLKLQEANEQVEYGYGLTHVCPKLTPDLSHNIQTHSTSLDIFDKASLRRDELDANEALIVQTTSPATSKIIQLCPPGILTPPASNRKSSDLNIIPN